MINIELIVFRMVSKSSSGPPFPPFFSIALSPLPLPPLFLQYGSALLQPYLGVLQRKNLDTVRLFTWRV